MITSTLTTITVRSKARCGECARIFDLMNEDDANEYYYGHDCEVA